MDNLRVDESQLFLLYKYEQNGVAARLKDLTNSYFIYNKIFKKT